MTNDDPIQRAMEDIDEASDNLVRALRDRQNSYEALTEAQKLLDANEQFVVNCQASVDDALYNLIELKQQQ